MSSTASFAAAPSLGVAQPTTANTNRDGTGVFSTIVTGAANGTRVDRVEVQSAGPAASAASANVLRLFLFDGTNTWLLRELAVATFTPSSTAAGFQYTFSFPAEHPLVLKNTWALKCAPHAYAGAQDKYNWVAVGGDL